MRRLCFFLAAVMAVVVLGAARATSPPSPPSPPAGVVMYQTAATLAVTTVSANVALPASSATYPFVGMLNDGASEIFVTVGAGAGLAATTTALPVPAGACLALWAGGSDHVAAITAAGTSTARVLMANGPPCK